MRKNKKLIDELTVDKEKKYDKIKSIRISEPPPGVQKNFLLFF